MKFAEMIAWVQGTIARYPSEFAAGRARQPALERFKDGTEVATYLKKLSTRHAERLRVIAATLEEYKQNPREPVWAAILVVAFAPMLMSMRRAYGEPENPELDQMVLFTFLKALASPLDGKRPAIAIHGAMCRFLKREREIQKRLRRDVPISALRRRTYTIDKVAELRQAIELLPKVVDGNQEMVDVVLDTVFGGEPLSEYVDRVHSTLDAQAKNRLVDRLRRQREAVIHRLRRRLEVERSPN